MNLKNKKILVTGADGFIGSHLVEKLVDSGAQVRAFCYYNSFNSWGWIDTFPKDKQKAIDIVMGDIRDPGGLKKAMKDIEVVFHLAALIGIPYSYESPESYVATNINGTLHVLLAARECGAERILVTSTSEVYGTARYVPIDENHPRQGQSPYSASKIAADAIAESFHHSFGLPVTIVRPFNTFGPRQSSRAVIPSMITQLLSGQKEIKIGNVLPTRDFLYVKDTVDGFLEIAQHDALVGHDVNLATNSEISIGDLAHELFHLINPSATIKTDPLRNRPATSEVFRLLGSNEKLKKFTGWQPKYTLRQGLAETIEWFRKPENTVTYKSDRYNV